MSYLTNENALALLNDLVKLPSYIGASNPDAENLVGEYLKNWIKRNLSGYELVGIAYGKKRRNLLYKTAVSKILFACHMDTVPTEKRELKLKIEGDNVYGLGTKDMKGGIVSMLLALKEIQNIGIKNSASILFYGDEEYAQAGMRKLVTESENIPKPTLIISPESRFNIGYGARGVCVVKFSILGKTAHSARPHLGIDAIQLFYKVYSVLCKKLSKKTLLGKSVVTLTELTGGLMINGKLSSQANMIPNYAAGVISIRLAQMDILSENIEKIIRGTVTDSGSKIENFEILNDYPAFIGSKKILKPITSALRKNGLEVNLADPNLAGYNDAALLANKLNVPIINFGPYGENNHSPDEWVSIQSILDTAKVYVSLIKDF